MCTSEKQIERYEKVLEGMEIVTEYEDDGVTPRITYALFPNNAMVIIDEKQKPPRAIRCMEHEFQSGCESLQAVNYFYQKIASMFAYEGEQEPLQPIVRNVYAEQNNRVEYQVVGSCGKHYHTVPMYNGRAINCFDHLGAKCQARHFKPGVPCSHMDRANVAEEEVRAHTRIEQAMQQEPFAHLSAEMQQIAHEELAKCNEAYQAVMRQPIGVEPGHPDYWPLLQRRERKAKQAYRKQYQKSVHVLEAAGLAIAA